MRRIGQMAILVYARQPFLAVNFLELRYGEVQHSLTPIGQGRRREARGCSYRALCVVYADTRDLRTQAERLGEGLGHQGGAERRAGAP